MARQYSMCLSRRQALLAGAGTVIASVVPPSCIGIADRLRRLSRDPWSAREIGRSYAETVTASLAPDVLAALLLRDLRLAEEDCARLPERRLSHMVDARVRADFAAGRTADVDGWILSLTEARLAALWA
jgi:hypothetical protein